MRDGPALADGDVGVAITVEMPARGSQPGADPGAGSFSERDQHGGDSELPEDV